MSLWLLCLCVCLFFFKQKTAYEMRISDWSSDVCSSDLNVKSGDANMKPIHCLSLALVGAALATPLAAQAPARTVIHAGQLLAEPGKIGRASCRERVCTYV